MTLHPDYPVVSGSYRLTDEWTVDPDREQTTCGSISGHVPGTAGSVRRSAYFDTPQDRSVGYEVIHSVRCVA
jgi:hypothetical protein